MRITAIIATLLIAVAVIGAGCTQEGQPPQQVTGDSVLLDAVSGINDELESVRASTAEDARALGETGLTSTAGKEAVRQTMLDHPYTESALVITKDGIVVTAVPDNYADLVNSDLSSNP